MKAVSLREGKLKVNDMVKMKRFVKERDNKLNKLA